MCCCGDWVRLRVSDKDACSEGDYVHVHLGLMMPRSCPELKLTTQSGNPASSRLSKSMNPLTEQALHRRTGDKSTQKMDFLVPLILHVSAILAGINTCSVHRRERLKRSLQRLSATHFVLGMINFSLELKYESK